MTERSPALRRARYSEDPGPSNVPAVYRHRRTLALLILVALAALVLVDVLVVLG